MVSGKPLDTDQFWRPESAQLREAVRFPHNICYVAVWNHAVLTLLFFFIGEESWDHSTVCEQHCTVVPALLAYKEEKQGQDGVVPDGYITYIDGVELPVVVEAGGTGTLFRGWEFESKFS
jgi:hypothetical protein